MISNAPDPRLADSRFQARCGRAARREDHIGARA
jgi:hypothetical protein